jgi:hypothetical protein
MGGRCAQAGSLAQLILFLTYQKTKGQVEIALSDQAVKIRGEMIDEPLKVQYMPG